MMQITDLQQEQQLPPLFRLGFRPFFLSGAIFSAVAIILWLFILRGKLPFDPVGGGYWWHMHEMVYGFAGAIIAGFLLTAVQNWTGIRGINGKPLMFLFVLWLAGRLLLLFPVLGVGVSLFVDIAFLPCVAFLLGKPIIAIKQYRNLFFMPLLLIFTLANLQMYGALFYPDIFYITHSGYIGVMLVTLLMSIMAGRVFPMFTANGTQTQKVEPIKWLEWLANGSLAFSVASLFLSPLIGFNATLFAALLILSAASQFVRWLRLKPWITLSVPLLWSLHSAMAFIAVGLLLLGLSYLSDSLPVNTFWHLLTVGGMGGLILAMIARVSLGHTGRMLSPPKIMSIAFLLISLAALVRVLGPWLDIANKAIYVDVSGLLWAIAFAIFAWIYGPMLLAPRQDGRPG